MSVRSRENSRRWISISKNCKKRLGIIRIKEKCQHLSRKFSIFSKNQPSFIKPWPKKIKKSRIWNSLWKFRRIRWSACRKQSSWMLGRRLKFCGRSSSPRQLVMKRPLSCIRWLSLPLNWRKKEVSRKVIMNLLIREAQLWKVSCLPMTSRKNQPPSK